MGCEQELWIDYEMEIIRGMPIGHWKQEYINQSINKMLISDFMAPALRLSGVFLLMSRHFWYESKYLIQSRTRKKNLKVLCVCSSSLVSFPNFHLFSTQ